MGRGANRRLLSHPLPSGILALQFNSGWPLGITAQNAGQTLPGVDLNNVNSVGETALQKFIGSFDTDTQHITNLANVQGSAQTYMAAVAPWFFTHFGADTFNKNVSGHGYRGAVEVGADCDFAVRVRR